MIFHPSCYNLKIWICTLHHPHIQMKYKVENKNTLITNILSHQASTYIIFSPSISPRIFIPLAESPQAFHNALIISTHVWTIPVMIVGKCERMKGKTHRRPNRIRLAIILQYGHISIILWSYYICDISWKLNQNTMDELISTLPATHFAGSSALFKRCWWF